MSENRDFFLKEKPVRALVMLKESEADVYCGEVSKSIDSTYAHTVKIISKFEEFGLLETRKDGRKKMMKLTNSGEEQALKLIQLLELYEDEEEEKGRLQDKDILS